jgi:hypothetical protein
VAVEGARVGTQRPLLPHDHAATDLRAKQIIRVIVIVIGIISLLNTLQSFDLSRAQAATAVQKRAAWPYAATSQFC